MTRELVIHNCDAADERGPRPGRIDIAVSDGVITRIGSAEDMPASDSEALHIDGQGTTVVPGLINMHEHLGVVHPGTSEEKELSGETPAECLRRMRENAERALRVGVTAVRLAGERDGLDIRLRASISARRAAGPRVWTAAQPLDYPGGGRGFVGAVECASVDDYRRTALAQAARGADFLKVMVSGSAAGDDPGAVGLTVEGFHAVRQVARDTGLRIALHTAAIRHPIMDVVVEDGVDSLEHCYLMDEELLQRCVDGGILLVLTPLVGKSPEYVEDLGLAASSIRKMQRTGKMHWRTVCSAVQSNARIALGTDLHSHVKLHGAPAPVRELELYEEAGASPQMLLGIASRNGAWWLGVGDRLGLVEEGFAADLLILEDNPFNSGAAAFRQRRHVISRGVLVQG